MKQVSKEQAEEAFTASKQVQVTFKAVTRWSNNRATRIVNDFTTRGVKVAFGGHSDFRVRHHEIEAFSVAS